ncbi:MAG: disulfide bond formation protein B [Burkholderiales bacterium]|nr:disulfide bond formation protein B [Burkholderiales bacterium]
MILDWLLNAPRRTLALVAGVCVALLLFGAYLQHVVGLEPCPMCIVQRYAMIGVGLCAGIAAIFRGRGSHLAGAGGALLFSGFGAFVAARQSWLQWNPPEVSSCGRDFYGMIENFPLSRAIPLIFRGSGDCSKIDWTFLGLTIANWSFVWFVGFVVLAIALIVAGSRGARTAGLRASQA